MSAISEMQMKTTLRFHFSYIKKDKIKKTNNNNAGADVGEGKHFSLLGGMQTGAATVGIIAEFLKRLGIPFESATSLLGIYQKDYIS